jgi:hypothetical protein
MVPQGRHSQDQNAKAASTQATASAITIRNTAKPTMLALVTQADPELVGLDTECGDGPTDELRQRGRRPPNLLLPPPVPAREEALPGSK